MLRKIWRNPQAVIGLGLIVLICAVAILAPLLAPHASDEVNPLMKYQAPSADYPLGTDQLGRCELSRLLYGARASLGLALPILILLGGIGLILGMMTACIGGWFDRVVTGISQVFIAFPTLIIAVAIIGVLGNGLQNIIWAVVISMWARFMQLIRTYAKTELGRDYIVAARVSGCGMWQLIVHHLIPNILPQFLVYFSRFPAFRFSALVCPAERLNGAQCWRKRRWRCIPTRNCSFTPVSAFSLPPQASICLARRLGTFFSRRRMCYEQKAVTGRTS